MEIIEHGVEELFRIMLCGIVCGGENNNISFFLATSRTEHF
jgi:hypothetical protein